MTAPPPKMRKDAALMHQIANSIESQRDPYAIRQLLRIGAENTIELARQVESMSNGLGAQRVAYLKLDNDASRNGFVDAMLHHYRELPDGAFCGVMQEVLGDEWVYELIRLGFLADAERGT